MDKWLWMLSGVRILGRGEGDCNVVKSCHGSVQADFQSWKIKFMERLQSLCDGEKKVMGSRSVRMEAQEEEKEEEVEVRQPVIPRSEPQRHDNHVFLPR